MNAALAWRQEPAEIDGIGFCHRIRDADASGAAAPLVLVHGIGPGTDSIANFGRLLDRLPAAHPVHLIDLIGFGRSQRPNGPAVFDPELWQRQIGQVLDGLQRPLLVGNSVGGALALRIASTRQDLLGVLAIGAPAAPQLASPALRAFWRAPADRAELARAMRPMTASAQPPDPDLVVARWDAFSQPGRAAWFDALLADPDECLARVALSPAEAARIVVPVRLLHGRQDRACSADALAEFARQHLPQADLTLLGHCGHNLINERTGDVAAQVALLLDKASP